MEEIKLQVMPNGEIRIEVKGVAGPACLELTQLIEEDLGLVTKRVKTDEYYAAKETVPLSQYNRSDRTSSRS